jgi:hypothetical protein
MPKTKSANKPVHSFRLSLEGVSQLRAMASVMGRSESDVLEVALDRMYREEIRYNRVLRESVPPEDLYQTGNGDEGNAKTDRGGSEVFRGDG